MNQFKNIRLSGRIQYAYGYYKYFIFGHSDLKKIDKKFYFRERINYSGNTNLKFLLDKRVKLKEEYLNLRFFQFGKILNNYISTVNIDEDIINIIIL